MGIYRAFRRWFWARQHPYTTMPNPWWTWDDTLRLMKKRVKDLRSGKTSPWYSKQMRESLCGLLLDALKILDRKD